MTTQVVVLDLFIPSFDPTLFDSIEVWRSTQGESGPYDAVTTLGARGARIPALIVGNPPSPPSQGPLVNASGLTLQLEINGQTDITVTITGSDPLHYSDLATQITAQGRTLLSSFVIGANLVVETTQVGSGVELEVIGGDLAAITGLTIGVPSSGTESYVALVRGQQHYPFIDKNGSLTDFYKTRLRNTVQNIVGEFSTAFQPTTLPPSSTILAILNLVNIDGRVLQNREVRIQTKTVGDPTSGFLVAGTALSALTDANGHVEFVLVRGLVVQVAVSGTNLVRDVTVPTDPAVTSFNLFDPAYGSDDLFQVDVPNVPYANRTSF